MQSTYATILCYGPGKEGRPIWSLCGAGAPETGDGQGEEEEEEEECGFCIFMKGGGCKDSFTVTLLITSA
jgi:hypothetical protein